MGPQIAPTATAPIRVHISGVAKKALPNQPFIVANELICAALARLILLPCPPGALMESSNDTYYFSLDFNIAGQQLPPVDPGAVVAAHPELSWGIILFDILVMNSDRHAGNVALDAATQKVQIFDHSHAMLTPGGDIDQNLSSRQHSLAIGGHCLAQEIGSRAGMQTWLDRIQMIPDYFIEGVVAAATECGVPANKAVDISDFLKDRRDSLGTLVSSHLTAFPKLPPAPPPQPMPPSLQPNQASP